MNLPERNEDTFCKLAEDFNKSAKTFAQGSGLTLDGLMTKFDVLWKFKAECPHDKGRLTQALFDGSMDILRKISDPNCRDSVAGASGNFTHIFNFLTTSEQMQYLPANASDQLVDAALGLINKSEGVGYVYGWNDYSQHKNDLIGLAKTVATFAEKTREPKPAGATFAIAKTIPPVKRLTISTPEGGV